MQQVNTEVFSNIEVFCSKDVVNGWDGKYDNPVTNFINCETRKADGNQTCLEFYQYLLELPNCQYTPSVEEWAAVIIPHISQSLQKWCQCL